jgi:glutaminase
VICSDSEFCSIIKDVFEEVQREVPHDVGRNAQYIPELADVSPLTFSVSIVSCHGQTVQYGDYEEYFSIQSCMKPLLYSFNLAESGAEYVHK